MSATFAPAVSLASAPSRAGIQPATRLAAYPGLKKRSQPENTSSSCSCQPTPAPVRNAWMTFCSDRSAPSASSNAPGAKTAPSGSVSAKACSGVSEYAPLRGS